MLRIALFGLAGLDLPDGPPVLVSLRSGSVAHFQKLTVCSPIRQTEQRLVGAMTVRGVRLFRCMMFEVVAVCMMVGP